MKKPFISNLPVIALATTLILGGIDIAYRGTIRTIVLGEEKYFVGGVLIAFGLYLFYLVLAKKTKK